MAEQVSRYCPRPTSHLSRIIHKRPHTEEHVIKAIRGLQSGDDHDAAIDEETEEVRQAALGFMISPSAQ